MCWFPGSGAPGGIDGLLSLPQVAARYGRIYIIYGSCLALNLLMTRRIPTVQREPVCCVDQPIQPCQG